VRRLLPWLAVVRWRLALSVLLGFLAIGSGVALLATSAYLISSAALMPPILTLEVAIVGVRAFGIGKGVARYAERIVSHDAAFRALSGLRLAVYDRLAVVAPAGVPAYRRGDLLERLVRDVDATQDLPLRVILPYVSGGLVAVGSVILAYVILPVSALVLGISLLLAATLVPWITAKAAADAERASAPARGVRHFGARRSQTGFSRRQVVEARGARRPLIKFPKESGRRSKWRMSKVPLCAGR